MFLKFSKRLHSMVCADSHELEQNILKNPKTPPMTIIKAYKQRWFILIIYIAYAALSTLQWLEYSIITDVVMKYYDVSASDVNWTSIIFMLMWPTLVFPTSFIIDRMGLRVAGLFGALLTALGAAVKILSIGRNLFYVVLIGQFIVAMSQTFILSLPPKIAVTWFKQDEISTVCSLGIFGMTLGSALGFLIPPMIVNNHEIVDEIGADLKILCYGLALTITPFALMVIYYFPAEPPHPPSHAMYEEKLNRNKVTFTVFIKSTNKLLMNKSFLIHAVSYGCNVGIFSVISTLLNQSILNYFEDAQEDAGRMGLVMILTGMIGSVFIGIILDKTHKYKETALALFILSVLSLSAFLVALEMRSKWMVYITIAIFGCFLNSYMPVGVELAAEITFPSPESTVAGLLMASSQVLAVVFTLVFDMILTKYGTFYSIAGQLIVLLVGTVTTIFTPNNLMRQAAFNKNIDFEKVPEGEKIFSPQ